MREALEENQTPHPGTVFFFENVFPNQVSKELVNRLLEKPSTDGHGHVLAAGGNSGFRSAQIHFPGATRPLKSVSSADKADLPAFPYSRKRGPVSTLRAST